MALGTAHAFSASCVGHEVERIKVEASITRGLPVFQLVGMSEKSARSSRDRVRAALLSSGFTFPSQRVLVNLSPGDVPKSGCAFDFAIAMAILLASKQLKLNFSLDTSLFVGEMELNGAIKPVKSMLPLVLFAKKMQSILACSSETPIPEDLLADVEVWGVASLQEAQKALSQPLKLAPSNKKVMMFSPNAQSEVEEKHWTSILGEIEAKCALLVAASGRHHLLFSGPPGVGKTMMVGVFQNLLPDLCREKMLEVALMHSMLGELHYSHRPPFRKPHHNVTPAALIGGGNPLMPGEVSLAHHGVLFLDELTEFQAKLLDQLRQPLADQCIDISRAYQKNKLPSNIQLVACMNPCMCGYWGVDDQRCVCGHLDVKRYRKRLSGPLLDRLDMGVYVGLEEKRQKEQMLARWVEKIEGLKSTKDAQSLVWCTKERQLARFGCLNSHMPVVWFEQHAKWCFEHEALKKLGLRGQHKTVTVAMTIADLFQEPLCEAHVDLALAWSGHRHPGTREYW